MQPTHDQLLADLEARLRVPGESIDAVDGRVASALGVDVETYRAFLVVRGALEARRQLSLSTTSSAGPPASGAGVAARLRRQLDVIGSLAAILYQRACDVGDREAVAAAARVLGSLPATRHTLATLEHAVHGRRRGLVRRG